jgi:chromate reductase
VSAPRPARVLGISGSLRRDSYNTQLLALASRLLPDGVEYRRLEGLKAVPPFDEDDEHEPFHPGVVELRRQIAWADGVLFATPEYNASIPGQLKNAVDWASRPFATTVLRDKNVAVVGASTSMFGAVWAQAHLRGALGAAGARVIDRELAVAVADEQFAADGTLLDAELTSTLAEIVATLMDEIEITRRLAACATESPGD